MFNQAITVTATAPAPLTHPIIAPVKTPNSIELPMVEPANDDTKRESVLVTRRRRRARLAGRR